MKMRSFLFLLTIYKEKVREMNKKQVIRINENQLRRIVAESIKKVLNENYNDEHYKMKCLSALQNLVEDHGLQYVMLHLGNEIGWDKMSAAITYAFSGDDDSYVRHQEMRSPFGG